VKLLGNPWLADNLKFLKACLFTIYRASGMLDLISMWKNPKMIGYFALTAALYAIFFTRFRNIPSSQKTLTTCG
jgi:hypothetical protein